MFLQNKKNLIWYFGRKSLSQEATAMRFDVVEAGRDSCQVQEDVEEEHGGEGVEVAHQELHLHLRHSQVGVGQLVDRHWEIDGDDDQAVQPG